MRWLGSVILVVNLFACSSGESPKETAVSPYSTTGTVERLDLRINEYIAREAVIEVLAAVAKGASLADAAKQYKLLSDDELAQEIARILFHQDPLHLVAFSHCRFKFGYQLKIHVGRRLHQPWGPIERRIGILRGIGIMFHTGRHRNRNLLIVNAG